MLDDRFWPKVDVRGPDECWPWRAGTNGVGYGMIYPGGDLGKKLAHRISEPLGGTHLPPADLNAVVGLGDA